MLFKLNLIINKTEIHRLHKSIHLEMYQTREAAVS